jgi:hypothetical protein
MNRIIKITDEQQIEVRSTQGWLFVYEENFGHDIMPDLWPLLDIVGDIIAGAKQEKDGNLKIEINADVIEGAKASIASFEYLTIVRILWAMAKNANPNIPPVMIWADQFDVFPLDVILPELIKILVLSYVSTKNSSRLLAEAKKVKESTSTQLRLQEQ